MEQETRLEGRGQSETGMQEGPGGPPKAGGGAGQGTAAAADPQGMPTRGESGKTFTQDEVNEIVRKRLARERESREQGLGETGRLARELELREQDVRKREWKMEAKERLMGKGLPPEAANFLCFESEEGFEESLAGMLELLGPKMQAAVEDVFQERGTVPPKSTEVKPTGEDFLKEAFLRRK